MQKHSKTQKKQGGKRRNPARKTTRFHKVLKSMGFRVHKTPTTTTIVPTKIQMDRMKKLPHFLNLSKKVKK